MPASVRNDMQVVKDTIREYEIAEGKGIQKTELMGILAGQISEIEVQRILDKLKESGELYSPSFGLYKILDLE
jgi:DNA replicative helicase MCM subunit Mcm2 (Cdc46/Mcm family)